MKKTIFFVVVTTCKNWGNSLLSALNKVYDWMKSSTL